jgi:hypothetical protein
MEILLLVIGTLAGLLGILGSIFPALPGPLLTYSALFILYYIGGEELIRTQELIITGMVAVFVLIISNLVPIATAKISGASKNGFWGAIIGSIIGFILFPPLGLFVGAIIGTIIGEFYEFRDTKKSLVAGVGTASGAIIAIVAQTALSVSIFIFFLYKITLLF